MSIPPPAGAPTIIRTGRDGYVSAAASRDITGSMTAPAVRLRNRRRGTFMIWKNIEHLLYQVMLLSDHVISILISAMVA
jgi:hypothetical protein